MRQTVLTFLLALLPLLASADTVEIDGIWYNIITKAGIAEVIKNPSTTQASRGLYKGDIIIPEKIVYNGKEFPITKISDEAFYDCNQMYSVTIPQSVTTIGNRAFYWCLSLSTVNLSPGLEEIGNKAFYNCNVLKSITIPSTLTKIGFNAFERCDKLKATHIEDLKSWCNISFDDFYSNPSYYSKN